MLGGALLLESGITSTSEIERHRERKERETLYYQHSSEFLYHSLCYK